MSVAGGEGRRLMEGLQTELRALSNEAKKKYPAVRDACEACLVKVKNLASTTDQDSMAALRKASPGKNARPLTQMTETIRSSRSSPNAF